MKTVETLALLDSGAGGVFIDQRYATQQGFTMNALDRSITVFNVDGTKNKKGTINQYIDLNIDLHDRIMKLRMFVTGLGKQKVILGFPWLQEYNPDVDWKQGTLRWKREEDDEDIDYEPLHLTEENLEDPIIIGHLNAEEDLSGENIWINAKFSQSMLLSLKHDEKKEGRTVGQMVPKEYHEYLSVFNKEEADRFPSERHWDHAIELKEDFKPKSFKSYPIPPSEEKALKDFVDENLKRGYIRPSKSPMASPFFFVGKKDGKLRPCQDYRYLNDWTVKNAYGLHHIDDLLNQLKGAKYFTKMDVRWGYNNVRIKKGDEWKAAFKTKFGLFEPTVMFFGLCNAPATFQSMMDAILAEQVAKGYVIVYMDDILVFSSNLQDLRRHIREVLRILKENNLFLKPEKCEFEKTKIDYLGFIVEEGKICMDPTKVKGIIEWPQPLNVKQLRSFLGFANFYRRFIRSYSELAKPLNELLQKDKTFEWTAETEKAFVEMKERFSSDPVLMMPDPSKPFQIESDASKYASGAVLTQMDENGNRHPTAFLSKSFSPAERNYEIYDRELLAIIRAITEWRYLILGSPHPTVVLSDHKNLTFFRSAQKLNRRQARWSLLLSEYDIQLIHIPGSKMILSDALSRRPDLCPDEDHDNEDITMLPETLFVNFIDTELQDRI